METEFINLANMSKGIIIKKVSINDILESIPNYDNIDVSLLNNDIDNLELQKINDYPLDESFSLIFSKENLLKNSLEFSDMQFLNNSNNKNMEGDKDFMMGVIIYTNDYKIYYL